MMKMILARQATGCMADMNKRKHLELEEQKRHNKAMEMIEQKKQASTTNGRANQKSSTISLRFLQGIIQFRKTIRECVMT